MRGQKQGVSTIPKGGVFRLRVFKKDLVSRVKKKLTL